MSLRLENARTNKWQELYGSVRIPSELIIKLVFEDVIFYTVEHNIGDNLFCCYRYNIRKDLLPIKMEM